jgi:uncharacterized protein YceK
MNQQLSMLIILALMTQLGTGCTSIRARTELPAADWTLYPGVKRDVSDLGDAIEGKLKGPGWIPVVVVPMLVADLPFSTVMDTCALPYDVYRVHQAREMEGQQERSPAHSGGEPD